jgi:hypothetical protein
MFHELLSRDRRDDSATGSSQGLGPEAYLTVRRRVRGPRTPERTTISAVAVTPGRDETCGLAKYHLVIWPILAI